MDEILLKSEDYMLVNKTRSLVAIVDSCLRNTEGEVKFYGNPKIGETSLTDCLASLCDFDGVCGSRGPDGYSIVGDSLFVMEHFEFDSTKVTKKGSSTRKEDDRISREFDAVISTDITVPFRDSYNISHSSQNYITNALSNANAHYNKIDLYIDNLRECDKLSGINSIKTGFFIEDKSVLGNVCLERVRVENLKVKNRPETNIRPIILCQTKQFLDWLGSNEKIDFCFCSSTYGDKSFVWFINREAICEYRKHEIDMEQIEILNFTPQVGGFKIVISNDDMSPQGTGEQV